MTTLRMPLSERGVALARKELSERARGFEGRCAELVRRLSDRGAQVARVTVRKDTGDLEAGIGVEERGQGFCLVVSDGAYCAFVEFGTGVVGQASPYPAELPVQWDYDQRRTPSAHDPHDPTVWYYRDRDGHVRRTRGQTPNAYMLTAAEQMRRDVVETAREVFRW